jgi:hypothetical protein
MARPGADKRARPVFSPRLMNSSAQTRASHKPGKDVAMRRVFWDTDQRKLSRKSLRALQFAVLGRMAGTRCRLATGAR